MAEVYKGLFLKLGLDGQLMLSELEQVDKRLRGTQGELRQLQQSLKLEFNADKFAQAQSIVQKNIDETKKRVELLKKAKEEADKQGMSKSSDEYIKLQDKIKKAESAVERAIIKSKELDKIRLSALQKETDDTEKEFKQLEEAAKKAGDEGAEAGSKMLDAFSMVKALAIGYTGKTLFNSLIGSNIELEQTQTSFEVLLKDVDKARTMISELTDLAAVTPLNTTDLEEATTMLLGYGVEAEKIIDTLKRLGDLSQGNADRLDRVSLAYGQMLAKGKVSGEELRQMTEAQVPMLQGLSDYLKLSAAEVQKLVSEGKVGIDDLNGAINQMTSEGGQFFGMMEKQGQTLQGMFSTLTDEISIFARDAGIEAFGILKSELSDLLDTIKRMGEDGSLASMAEDIGEGVAKAVSTIVWLVENIYNMRGAIIGSLVAVQSFKAGMAMGEVITGTINAIKTYTKTLNIMDTLHKSGIATQQLWNLAKGQTIVLQDIEMAKTLAKTGLVKAKIAVVNGATVAQVSLNKAMLANPIGILIGLILAVTAAVVGYKIATGEAASESEKIAEKIRDEAKAYDELKESIEKKEQQSLSEISNTERLYKELEELSAKEEKTIDDKNRMKVCIEEINKVLPGTIDLIDSETMAYNVQGGAIDLLIAKKRALIMLESKEAAYKEAVKNIEGTQYNAQYYGDKANELFKEAKEIRYSEGFFNITKSEKIEREANQMLENYQISNALYKQHSKDISDYENAYADYIKQFGSIDTSGATSSGSSVASSPTSGSKTSSSSSGSKISSSAKEAEQSAKEAEREAKESRDKEFSDLKWHLDMGYITEAEYYDKLRELRDKYFAEGSTEWQKYTLDIKKYTEKLGKEEEDNRQKQAKDYSDDIAEKERLDERLFNSRKARGELNLQDEADFLTQRAKNYRAYADIAMRLEYLTAEEKQELHKEYTEKAEDYELEAFLFRKKMLKEAEKAANESFQNQIQALQDYHKLKTDGIKATADFEKETIKNNTEYAISQIKRQYEAQEKLLNAKLEGIDKEIEARRRLREDENQDDEIAKIQKQIEATKALIAYEKDANNIINLQRQLERQQEELADAIQEKDDTAFYRQKESEKEDIQNQIAQLREREKAAEEAARAKEQAAIIAAERESARQIQADAKAVQAQIKELNNEYFDYSNANYSYDSRTQTVVLQGATLTPAMLAKYFNMMG